MFVLERHDLLDRCYLRQAFEFRLSGYFPVHAPIITNSLSIPYIPQWYEDAWITPELETCEEFDVLSQMHQPWDRAATEIYGALVDGNLRGYGRKIPRDLDSESWSADDFPFVAVPSGFWKLDQIDWLGSSAKNDFEQYVHVLVDFTKLIELFPLSGLKPYPDALVWGHHLIDLNAVPVKAASRSEAKRGRKPLGDWKAFEEEMLRRLFRKEAPLKLEAFCSEMTEWCRAEGWSKIPSRSSVMDRISNAHRIYKECRPEIDD